MRNKEDDFLKKHPEIVDLLSEMLSETESNKEEIELSELVERQEAEEEQESDELGVIKEIIFLTDLIIADQIELNETFLEHYKTFDKLSNGLFHKSLKLIFEDPTKEGVSKFRKSFIDQAQDILTFCNVESEIEKEAKEENERDKIMARLKRGKAA